MFAMKTTMTLRLRVFSVELTDTRTGEKSVDTIVLERGSITDAEALGMTCESLIYSLYNRQGYRVDAIHKAKRVRGAVDLLALYQQGES